MLFKAKLLLQLFCLVVCNVNAVVLTKDVFLEAAKHLSLKDLVAYNLTHKIDYLDAIFSASESCDVSVQQIWPTLHVNLNAGARCHQYLIRNAGYFSKVEIRSSEGNYGNLMEVLKVVKRPDIELVLERFPVDLATRALSELGKGEALGFGRQLGVHFYETEWNVAYSKHVGSFISSLNIVNLTIDKPILQSEVIDQNGYVFATAQFDHNGYVFAPLFAQFNRSHLKSFTLKLRPDYFSNPALMFDIQGRFDLSRSLAC
jgi:hypothetical protein